MTTTIDVRTVLVVDAGPVADAGDALAALCGVSR